MALNLPPDCPPEVREFEERIEREMLQTVATNLQGLDIDDLYRLYVAYIKDANESLHRDFPTVDRERFVREVEQWASDTPFFTRITENLRKGFRGVTAVVEIHEQPLPEGIGNLRETYEQHLAYLADLDHTRTKYEAYPDDFPFFTLALQTPRQYLDVLAQMPLEYRMKILENHKKVYAKVIEEGIRTVRAVIDETRE